MVYITNLPDPHLELSQTAKMERFAKIVNGFLVVDYFHQTLHFRCLLTDM